MMKKLFNRFLMLSTITFLSACNGAGGGTQSSEESDSVASNTSEEINPNITDQDSLNYAFSGLYTNGEVKDAANGFSSVSDVRSMKAFNTGKYVDHFTSISNREDVKLELYNDHAMRFVNVSNGYVFSLPFNEVEVDYSIAKQRTTMTFGDSILNVSFESGNPYTSLSTPWYTYGEEWLMRYLLRDEFIGKNGLQRTVPCKYSFTPSNPFGDLEFKDGYDVYFFGVKIAGDDNNQIERPYYNIGIVRVKSDPKNFCLFVMKSKTEQSKLMEDIVTSYSRITSKGTARNYFHSHAAKECEYWDEDTKALFKKLTTTEYVNWGVFSYSMPGEENAMEPGHGNYDSYYEWSKTVRDDVQQKWNHNFEIYPTYNHLITRFPIQMATALAGGTGTDGKPVLQFTLQFTTNNNIVADNITPMFDIMRGKHDARFRQFAKDMKAYGKPILIRLNNEMNTDWTSYCGMMTLLDPDIFVMTWRRLYDICVEEGCTNLIWIWNPISVSAPYSSWGEDLCYFPGIDYVQLLGGTAYEFNNYAKEESASSIKSFKSLYTDLYKKNSRTFDTEWKLIISEFACGSGGETTGELGRNRDTQAQWVKDMWSEINAKVQAEYVKQIRGAVWFNANDYSGNKIMNRLQIVSRPTTPTEDYSDLTATIEAFRQGFADQDARLGNK